ncbi:MAG: serine/threonine-protein kinase [Ktedonobacteraceae bacterium]
MVIQYRPEGSLWAWLRKRASMAATDDTDSAGDDKTQDIAMLPPGLPTDWPLQAEEVADYLRQAASALQYAHDRGFIHRDVKPENFLLRFDKQAADKSYKAFLLLSDFGLAKFFSNLTSTSQILGTPTYMAPEQFTGNACPESDQYALAVMAYCLLTGQPPFSGDPIHLMNQHLTADPPAVRIFAPALSARTEAVLDKALAKTPSERFPSIAEFADAFAQSVYAGQKTTSATRTPRPLFSLPAQVEQQDFPRRTVSEIFTPQVQNSPTVEQQLPYMAASSAPLTPTSGQQPQEFAQDMQTRSNSTPRLASSVHSAYKPQQNLQELPSPLSAPQRSFAPAPAISGPGQMRSDQAAYRQEGAEQALQAGQQDGQRLTRRKATMWIIGSMATVGVVAAAGGVYALTRGNGLQSKPHSSPSNVKYMLRGHALAVSSLAWSPDGSQLASGSFDHTVRLWKLNQPDAPLIIKKHRLAVYTLAWELSGTQIASVGRDNSIQIYSSADGSINKTFINKNAPISKIAWSQDATSLFISTVGDGLEKLVLSTGTIQQEGARAFFRTLALSPDGRYLAVGTDSGFLVLLTIPELRYAHMTRIHKSSIHALEWSPDSTLLASGSIDKTIQIFDLATEQIVHSLTRNSVINDLAWKPQATPGAERLAVGLADGSMHIWSLDNNTVTTYKKHTAAINAVSWGRQGLATGSSDKTIIIWNV